MPTITQATDLFGTGQSFVRSSDVIDPDYVELIWGADEITWGSDFLVWGTHSILEQPTVLVSSGLTIERSTALT